MRLSPHFTLEELSVTQVRGVDNTPPEYVVERLRDAATRMEAVRITLKDKPIIVTSGYRHPLVNKIVGGSPNSAHMHGYAVDFICPGFGTPEEISRALVKSKINWDQLIEEGNWVHLSFEPRMRQQVLNRRQEGFVAGLRDPVGNA